MMKQYEAVDLLLVSEQTFRFSAEYCWVKDKYSQLISTPEGRFLSLKTSGVIILFYRERWAWKWKIESEMKVLDTNQKSILAEKSIKTENLFHPNLLTLLWLTSELCKLVNGWRCVKLRDDSSWVNFNSIMTSRVRFEMCSWKQKRQLCSSSKVPNILSRVGVWL
jgi:hypothetical protein